MNGIKNVVFDFDGTLVDTAPLIIKTMQRSIKELNLPPKSEAECRATIGIRLEEIPSVLWPETSGLSQIFTTTYRRIFDELKRPLEVECFPGVVDTLRWLNANGYQLAIASSRSHKSLEEYVTLFNLNDCFCMLIGGNDVKQGKPAPDPVLTILENQNWEAAETLTVGDAPVDIMMGRGAKTLTCAVTYGNGKREELKAAGPNFIISSFEELKEIVENSQGEESN